MYGLHATRKLRDRAGRPIPAAAGEPTTWLGDWYGTVLFWRPQLALLVNELTLFPILMPLAPAAALLGRSPEGLGETMAEAGVGRRFIDAELAEMGEAQWAKTSNRSVIGSMNEFAFLADEFRSRRASDPIDALRQPDTNGCPNPIRRTTPIVRHLVLVLRPRGNHVASVNRVSTLLMAFAVLATGCSGSPTLTTLTTEAITTEISSEISTPPTTGPVTTTTTTTATQPPTTDVEFSTTMPSGEWTRTDPDVGGLIVQTRDLTWDGEAFYVLTRLGFGDQIVWRSTDGLEWVRDSMIGTSGMLDGPWELISVDGRLMAAGSQDGRATVWIDEGTTPWRTVDIGPGGVGSLVHHDGRYVALGRSMWFDTIQNPPPATEPHAVIWSSSDGESWEHAAGVELFGAPSYASGLVDGPVGLLTIGFVPDEEPPFDRVSGAYVSADGVTWEEHQPGGLDITQIDSIVGGPTGYVVYGLDSPILASVDGINWHTFSNGPVAEPDGAIVSIGGLAVFDGSLVMSGDVNFVPEGFEFNTSQPKVWFYTGDDDWALLGYPAWFDMSGTVYEMVSGNKTLVAHADTGETGEWALFTFTTGSAEP